MASIHVQAFALYTLAFPLWDVPMAANDKPLVLVDGSSYLFRAYHALPPLTAPDGFPTGAMHGVLNMLDKLRKDYAPTHMAVVFDAPGKTFREERYPAYKAHRPPMPDELRCQIAPLHELVRAQGYPLLLVEGVEADDVIGTLASRYAGPVVVSTGDKDMAQLVDARVRLVNTMTGETLDEAGVLAKFGVPPARIRDYLALMGDSVDNVPGVDKVGPKTAAKWLQEYGSLANIMTHAADFKGKIGDNLRAALAHLPLSYELVTIRCDVPLEVQPQDLQLSPPDNAALRVLYERYGFNSRLAGLGKTAGAPASPPVPDQQAAAYTTLLTSEAWEAWQDRLRAAGTFAFDTETTSLDYLEAQLVGVAFAIAPGEAAYLPLAHDYPGAPPQLDRATVLAQLKPLLEDASLLKIGQNLKYDRSVLLNHGIELRGIAHDTMLQSYVLDAGAHQHDFDTLCQKHLQHTTIRYEDIAGKGKQQLTFNQIPLEQAAPYAAEDADYTLRLHQHFWPRLQALPAQQELYSTLEMPLLTVLCTMERNGVKVDAALLAQQSRELAAKLEELEAQAHTEAGRAFNLASPKQLQDILFGDLGLPVLRRTPGGQPSTAEDVLEELAAFGHALPRLILQHRSLAKLKSTYTDKLPQQIHPRTGRVHTSYHQAVAATGRLSSSDPNLQNIPVRTEEGRRIRQAFIAEEGWYLLAADYSQIELRIMAHLSGDQGLLAAFAAEQDIHSATAAEVFGVPLEQVSKDQRRAAKAINFGLIYGMSAFGLAKQLGVDRKDAQAYIDRYFARYRGVQAYMDDIRARAHAQGYVETLFGRRLYLPDLRSKQAATRQYAERTAINAPLQGTAADIIKRAMLRIDTWLRASHLRTRLIMQVHDELVLEVPEAELATVRAHVPTLMAEVAQLAVPLVVDTGVGRNWDEAH